MAKSKKQKNCPAGREKNPPPPSEYQPSEIATVVWTLSVMTGLVCDIGAALARLYVGFRPDSPQVAMLAGMLLFAAAFFGVVSMALMAVVLKIRREPPPRGFIAFAVVVAVAPMVAIGVRAVMR